MFLPDYMPTNLDILNCRLKTTGITETVLTLGQLQYRYVPHSLSNLMQGFVMLVGSGRNDESGSIVLRM